MYCIPSSFRARVCASRVIEATVLLAASIFDKCMPNATVLYYFLISPPSLASFNPGEMQIENLEDATGGIMTPEHQAQMRRLARVRFLTTFEVRAAELLMTTMFSFANPLGSHGSGLLWLQRRRR